MPGNLQIVADNAGAFDQVAMGDDNALGQSGGSGGINYAADILPGADMPGDLAAAGLDNLIELVLPDNLFDLGVLADVFQLPGEFIRGDEQPDTAVPENMPDLFFLIPQKRIVFPGMF